MLHILRHIRRSFFIPGKVRTYLAYALGEIVLIVVGILIAVQIGDWNEQKREDAFELKLLGEINAAHQRNIEEIQKSIRMVTEAQESCQVLLDYLASDKDYHESLDEHFSKSLFYYTYVSDNSAFETAKFSGLYVLKNDQLRNQLSNIYEARMEWIDTVERRNHDYFYTQVTPIVTDLFQENIHMGTMKPLDFQALKKSHRYIHMLRNLEHHRNLDLRWFGELLAQMEEVESLIRKEITKS